MRFKKVDALHLYADTNHVIPFVIPFFKKYDGLKRKGLTMNFTDMIRSAVEREATDLHLEPGMPLTYRIRGDLQRSSTLLSSAITSQIARELAGDDGWSHLDENGSVDCTRSVAGVDCRINILKTDKGLGLAIRLLSGQTNTLNSCNLNPLLGDLLKQEKGLILITGATGSGKTTTLSALIEEINQSQQKHILTLENPIEYRFVSKKSLIRQRQVGLHTPSVEAGLLDSLREDPDIIVVGEMREPETMRLTLNAAETGHLVLATMHSASASEAISRIVMSFPAERQNYILAQLADTFIAVISQKLIYRSREQILVPVCEILMASHAVKNTIRKGELSKLISLMQTGASEGMWTFERYQSWLDAKKDWHYPQLLKIQTSEEPRTSGPTKETISFVKTPAEATAAEKKIVKPISPKLQQSPSYVTKPATSTKSGPSKTTPSPQVSSGRKRRDPNTGLMIHEDGRFEIPAVEHDFEELARQFREQSEDE